MATSAEGQQHPLGIYFKIWGLLFVLSTLSYLVDVLEFQGYLRWSLIVIFMLLKAGLIVAVFMPIVMRIDMRTVFIVTGVIGRIVTCRMPVIFFAGKKRPSAVDNSIVSLWIQVGHKQRHYNSGQ